MSLGGDNKAKANKQWAATHFVRTVSVGLGPYANTAHALAVLQGIRVIGLLLISLLRRV